MHLQWRCLHGICRLHDAGWQLLGSGLQVLTAMTAQQRRGKLAVPVAARTTQLTQACSAETNTVMEVE